MYLFKLHLNLHNESACRDFNNRYEMHRMIMRAFPEQLPTGDRILYRVIKTTYSYPPIELMAGIKLIMAIITVQSRTQPRWDHLSFKAGSLKHYLFTRPIGWKIRLPLLPVGHRAHFSLMANPTVKRQGKRYPIYGEGALLSWLSRKGKAHGFKVDPLNVRVVELGAARGIKQGKELIWHGVHFDGLLQVNDPSAFLNCIKSGIGSGKAFGFGMLLLSKDASHPS